MHSWVIPCLPLRKDAEGVCQRVLSEILWSHGRDVSPLEMSLWLGVASHPRASEIPKGEPKLALSEVKKTALRWNFKQFLSCTVLGPSKRKMHILTQKSGIQVQT